MGNDIQYINLLLTLTFIFLICFSSISPSLSLCLANNFLCVCGGSLGDRSLSQEEEIRRFSFGLDPDTFTEVEICEKTFSFKISTDIRPLPGWSSSGGGVVGGNGSCQNGRQPSSAFRRASLAVMSACKLFSNLKRKSPKWPILNL
jgi:hypothetical protein